MKKMILFMGLLTLLTSCSGSPLRYAVDRDGEEKRMEPVDDARCRSFGAKPGTSDYTNCRMQLAMQRSEQMRQQYNSALDSFSQMAPH